MCLIAINFKHSLTDIIIESNKYLKINQGYMNYSDQTKLLICRESLLLMIIFVEITFTFKFKILIYIELSDDR